MKGDSFKGHCQKKVQTTELKFPEGSCIQSNENPSVRWGGGIDDFCNSTVAKLILILVVQYTLTKKMNRQFNKWSDFWHFQFEWSYHKISQMRV